MRKFFVKENQINSELITILDEDVNHIKNVLRLNVGENLQICDIDSSKNYICEILELTAKSVTCKILEEIQSIAEGNVELHIFQGLPKADKMELIIQKGTELGVSEFVPVSFKRSIVKISPKDEKKKIDRWNKISEVAAKQSKRDIIPKVRNVESIKNVCNEIKNYDIVLLAYELEENNYIKNELLKIKNTKENYKIAVIIGPEGGIEKEEVEVLENAGAKVISLGKRILRTETVALQVSSIIMYELENGGN
ncbi:MAG TPA: 16S rRNA (uracil(1498)-N(3))-methyltransferase [Candidatus Scatovivens faecipullorum]|nr:16S rRNA (uracil(1498)-N(3))-methyltransferase [Candidatus Scatovivens faecipullorum]